MKSTLCVAFTISALGAAASAQQKTTVPAFFPLNQCTNQATADWTRIANAGSAVLAVVPEGGSGGYQTLTGTSLTSARNQFITNHNAGQLVLGYVATNFACDPTVTVQAVKDAVNAYYLAYPTQIQGIFFDLGPSLSCPTGQTVQDENTVQKPGYGQVYTHVSSNKSGKVMLNASQFKNEWVMTLPAADYAVTFEKPYYDWTYNYRADQNGGVPASWWTSSSYSGKLAHVIYSATQNDVSTAVTRSRTSTYGSPVFYLYDGTSQSYGGRVMLL